jgi:hypothetical protein
MSRKFLTALDLGKNELQNAAVQSLGTAPSSPVKFQLYGNTSDDVLYWWDGTAWVPAKSGAPTFGTITAEQAFGSSKADGVATTTARSDHAHGNPVHDNAAHSAITLNSLAPPTASINMNGQRIINLLDPIGSSDAATKNYADNIAAGLAWKDTVRAATTANITLSGTQTVDGVALTATQRCLVKNQSTASQNGIYDVAAGAWTRSADADIEAELLNASVFVSEGTVNADTAWVCTTNAPITVNTTSLAWVQFAGGGAVTAGAGLTQTGNTLDVGAGTGIIVAADSVALDTTFADGRYVNVTGGDSVAGPLTITGTGQVLLIPQGAIQADAITITDGAVMTTGPGSGITVGAGTGTLFWSRATTNTFDNPVTLPAAAPTAATDATNKSYVDGAISTAVTAATKRFAASVGGATSQAITHNLATRDVVVDVYRVASPYDTVECDVERTDGNTVTLRFTTAPAASEYRVVVLA